MKHILICLTAMVMLFAAAGCGEAQLEVATMAPENIPSPEPTATVSPADTTDGSYGFFTDEIERKQVKSVSFYSAESYPYEPAEDCYKIDGNTYMWWDKDENLYDVSIYSPKGVRLGRNYSEMFADCINLEEINFNNSFRTENVQDMRAMFYNCRKITYLDLTGFNTANVIDMSFMFSQCEMLDMLTISNVGFDTSRVTTMQYMFYDCVSLEEWPFPSITTPSVTNTVSMFQKCSKLQSADLSGFDAANITDMSYMFAGCKQLKTIKGQSQLKSETAVTAEMYLDTKWE